MSEKYDIVLYKNETYQCTFSYVDSLDQPILLDRGNGSTKMQIRPFNNNDNTPVVTISTIVASAPSEATGSPCFYFPYESPDIRANTFTIYIAQPVAETAFESLNEGQKYFYDIIVTKVGGARERLVSGNFTVLSGVTDI